MINVVLIWGIAVIILGTIQGIIILPVLLKNFVNTKPANKAFQNFTEIDQYTLIEQSVNANWQVALKFTPKCM